MLNVDYHSGAEGIPADDNFGYEECPYPANPETGEILIKTLYLSVDPALVIIVKVEIFDLGKGTIRITSPSSVAR